MRKASIDNAPIVNPRPDIISDEFVALMKDAGVVEAFLFGSISRREEGPASDIDVLVRFGHDVRLGEQLNLMVKLSRLTGRQVDLLTDVDPIFEPYIMPTLVPIPL
ncbi:MAG: nucleotidyltransferase domain-containing protein [Thermomicrobiales bacterium]|nr:nucleotidyltransferase domain-containing protein [Thermomicrobiales bacterium]MCO5220003.1 nucleotidyltransferase domain-containing protein [Thermomicrobiales bacterium]